MIWLTHQKLTYYTGNYDTFMKTVSENEVIQQKKYEKEQVSEQAVRWESGPSSKVGNPAEQSKAWKEAC